MLGYPSPSLQIIVQYSISFFQRQYSRLFCYNAAISCGFFPGQVFSPGPDQVREERLSKAHRVRKKNAFSSLPLEGKVPSAHTGRMRWKACVFAGSGKVAPVGAAIGRPPVGSGCISRTSDARPYGSSNALPFVGSDAHIAPPTSSVVCWCSMKTYFFDKLSSRT